MPQFQIIKELIVIFSVSLIIISIFKKLNLPSIPGFLIAGIIIGPQGLRLINEMSNIQVMAEIGVMLLLFTIGLEISFSKILELKKLFLSVGAIQVVLTAVLACIILISIGIDIKQSILLGILISISSTAIILKILSEKNELESPHGNFSLSISIFQDLAFVPLMIIVPLIAVGFEENYLDVITKLSASFIILIVAVFASRYLMPKIMLQLANLRLREAFTIGVIFLILGFSYLTESIGLSLALGAFIAGLILSETDFSHQVIADIIPLRDAFNSLFFVSIGLLLNLNYVLQFPYLILIATFGIILFKSLIIFLIIVFQKYPPRIGIVTGIGLAQVGEFSFVLAQTGLRYNLIQADFYSAFLASSIATMMLTPFLFQLASKYSYSVKDLDTPVTRRMSSKKMTELKNHVIVGGYGLNGRNLARVLKETGINYAVLELNPKVVKEFKEKKERINYGDITRRDILQNLNIKEANVIVFLISDLTSTKLGIKLAKELNPKIYCIVRTRFINEVEALIKLGADEVIPEEFETSLQIFSKVLEKYHIPVNIVMKQANIIRNEAYSLLRKEQSGVQPLSQIDKILAEGLTESYLVEDSNPNLEKSIKELNIRQVTGATIIAIIREGKNITNPSGSEIIKPGDMLVIYGNHMSVDKAIDLLNT